MLEPVTDVSAIGIKYNDHGRCMQSISGLEQREVKNRVVNISKYNKYLV